MKKKKKKRNNTSAAKGVHVSSIPRSEVTPDSFKRSRPQPRVIDATCTGVPSSTYGVRFMYKPELYRGAMVYHLYLAIWVSNRSLCEPLSILARSSRFRLRARLIPLTRSVKNTIHNGRWYSIIERAKCVTEEK